MKLPGEWECFLLSATIPSTWCNITEKKNLLVLPAKTVRLTPANYNSAEDLETTISKLLAQESANPTVSVDYATMRTTVRVTSDHTL